jgi:hypothetical protein
MEFKYGISAESLSRWLAFQRISALQELRGSSIGMSAAKAIVDAELEAIEFATLECELRKLEAVKGSEPAGAGHRGPLPAGANRTVPGTPKWPV